jgi:hypothetical protein
MDIIILEYEMTYAQLPLDRKKNYPHGYNACLILNILKEVEKTYCPVKVSRPTKKGTVVKYKVCKDANKLMEYLSKLRKTVIDFDFELNIKIPLMEE